jgi:polyisoprenoid-binding protein YceI
MKRIILLVSCSIIFMQVNAQIFHPDDAASDIHFTIKNFGINTLGTLKGLQGEIIINEQDCTKDYFNVTVEAATVNTGINARDHHLRSSDYFDVKKFPKLQFTSTNIYNNTADGMCWVTGKLVIKGISKTINFPFKVEPTSIGYRLQGQFTVNRLDFGVGSSSWVLANTVLVQLNVIAVK